MRRELWLAIANVVLTLVTVECAARVWIALRWPAGMAYELTHTTTLRGSYASDPVLPYTLAPHYAFGDHRHNALGFRGPELTMSRTAGVARIVLMGASTVYGPRVKNHETAAAQLEAGLRERGIPAEVVNAGVPGWTSRETRLSLEARVLPLSPDAIVIIDGRNDVYPQLFRNYRDDYGHYRDLDYDLEHSNVAWKRAFRVSYLLMGLMHRQHAFGFAPEREHPHYGSIRFENQPTLAEAEAWIGAPDRTRGFVENLRSTITTARAAGVQPVLATVPYRGGQAYVSGNLSFADGFEPAVTRAVAINQQLTRALAEELHVPLVDTRELSRAQYLRDDCHFNPAGHAAFAARLLEVVAPLVAAHS